MAGVVITVNGVALSTFASRVERMTRTTPALRGADIPVAGRHGALPVPRRRHNPGLIVWPMWVKGVNPTTGLISAGTTIDQIRGRYDDMSRLFHADPLDVRYAYPDGTVRQATARLALEPLEFDEQPGAVQFGRFAPALSIPAAFWSDLTAVSVGPTALATGTTTTLAGFAGATAPMDDLTVTFGPGSNPSLSQPLTGAFVAYDGVIAAGRKLVIDTELWAVTGTIDAGGTWTPAITAIRFGPESKFFYLTPPSDGTAPVVSLVHSGGSTMTVTVAGKRRFLTG